MRSLIPKVIFALDLLLTVYIPAFSKDFSPNDTSKLKTVIIIFDALRTDYITPELMPNLYALRSAGSYNMSNHSVFPTVTRVNAASYITGSYPASHGLMGNSLYIPEINKAKGQNTGDAKLLMNIESVTKGKLLTSVSLGEVLGKKGLMIFSSGTTGQAYLQNHKIKGAIINPEMVLPELFKPELIKNIGKIPEDATPNTKRHEWITDAWCRYGLVKNGPLVSAIWFSDPDGTAHERGIGSPPMIASLKSVDTELGRILDTIKARGLEQKINIIISADHGFVSYAGGENLTGFLIKKGFKQSITSDDVVVADGAVYVKDHSLAVINKIVLALQQQEWAGAVFTKAEKTGSLKGIIPGTLSFESIHWNHKDRAADILVAENWDDRKNSFGYPGIGYSNGVAGHGGSSPYEINIPLIAFGPSFKKNYTDSLPASNVDIVPTVLYINHIAVPAQMQGRILYELMKGRNKKMEAPVKETIVSTNSCNGILYTLVLERTKIGKYRYVNYAKATRTKDQGNK